MSPTSYQTAPPRDTEKIIGVPFRGVKLIINKINGLAKPLILLNLSSKLRSRNTFAPLSRFYHRFAADSSEGFSEDPGAAINLFIMGVHVDTSDGRDVGMAEPFLNVNLVEQESPNPLIQVEVRWLM